MHQEKIFEGKVKAYLKSKGAYVVKQFGCAFSQAGTPDLLCCLNGHFIAIELKSDKGKPTKLQLIKLQQIKDAGGVAVLLYPKDFDEFKALIETLK